MKHYSILTAALVTTIAAIATALPARADSITAYCSYHPKQSTDREFRMPCHFYEGQGHIVIAWEDGVVSDFTPESDDDYIYHDQNGGVVRRTISGRSGANYFEMENGTIEVEF